MKIRSKLLTALLAISLVPVITIGFVTYVNSEREIAEETTKKLSALASVQDEAIGVIMQNNLEHLIAFTTRQQMKIELDNFNRNGELKSQEFVNNLILSINEQIASFDEISVLNPDGLVVASTDKEELGVNHASNDFYLKGRQSNDVTLFIKDENQNPAVYLTGPLVLDGKLVGVAVIKSDVSSIYSITGIHSSLSQTGESFLVMRNQNGDALVITPLRFEPDAVLDMQIPKEELSSPATQALLGNEIIFTDYLDYRGRSVLATTRYIEGADLGLVVKIDKEEAFAPLENIKYLTVFAGLAVSALIVCVSLYLGKSISSPIISLRNKVTEISKGKFDLDVDVTMKDEKSDDEVKELAIHFDQMRMNLKSMNENLQQLVKEKTKDLESANKTLKVKNDKLENVTALLLQKSAELRKNEIARQEFGSMITHELKTPLVPIIGYGNMLLDGKLGELSSLQKNKLQIMCNNATRLVNLIQDLLDAEKLELGELRLDIREASVRQVIEESINSLKAQAEAKGTKLLIDLDQDLSLTCDSGRIIQVLTNLINNGIKFSPENAVIDVGAKLVDGSTVFSIKDNGIGIPKDKQDKLFTKFYQVDTSLTRKAGGTGLGLVICKGIVEAHKGKIWFESEVGNGSKFSFSIPVA